MNDYRARLAEYDRAFHEEYGEVFGGTAFDKYHAPPPVDGDTWGPWKFRQRDLTLQFDSDSDGWYEIDLEEQRSCFEVMHWLWHLMGKAWATPEVLGHLVAAIHDLSGMYDDIEKKTNISRLIVERYRPTTKFDDVCPPRVGRSA